jgi:hypothetical protein
MAATPIIGLNMPRQSAKVYTTLVDWEIRKIISDRAQKFHKCEWAAA